MDALTVSAIGNAPVWLRGLADEQLNMAVAGSHQRRHPDRLERMRSLQACIESFEGTPDPSRG